MTESFDDRDALRWIVDDLHYHQARVLLLVNAVAAETGHSRKLDGLTKLAKLDFLVRYPALAGAILDGLTDDDHRMHLTNDDVAAPTEAQDPMTRYKYGPWDDRYYPVVGALVSRGLLKYVRARKGSIALAPTPAGKKFCQALISDPLWHEMADRCGAIAEASAGLTGNALKERIYDRLESLMDRPHRQVIS